MNTPDNIRDPKWDEATRVHDWRNHIPEEIQKIWSTFTDEQLIVIYGWANSLAMNEDWD